MRLHSLLFGLLLLALASSGQARTFGTTYSAFKPSCAPGDGKTPEQWRQLGMAAWMNKKRPVADMYLCFLRAARAGDASAKFDLAKLYVRPPADPSDMGLAARIYDPDTALYWFSEAAEDGYPAAAVEIGLLYEEDEAFQDDAKAVEWYQRALALGDRTAQARIDAVRARAQRIQAFEAQYMARAEAGDIPSLLAVAKAYTTGNPYAKAPAKAVPWLIRAAEAGDPDSQGVVGKMYVTGDGAPRDVSTGLTWWLKAAHNGNHEHDIDILMLYRLDRLNAADRKRVQAAAEAGDLRNYSGGVVHFKADEAPPKPEQEAPQPPPERPLPVRRLTRDATAGVAQAQFELGLAYLDGRGVTADPIQARDWFEKAADQVSSADMNLGDLYQTGKLGRVDPVEAARWYGIAGIMGDKLGAHNAAIIYRQKDGVAYDPVKAWGMALALEMYGWSDTSSVFDGLKASLSTEQRGDALEWVAELALAHNRRAP